MHYLLDYSPCSFLKSKHSVILEYASTLFTIVALFSFVAYFISGAQATDFAALNSPTTQIILAINIILYTLAPSLYWRALKKLPASEVSILYYLTTVYILILGLRLGTEIFNLTRLLGGICIVAASLLLAFQTQRVNKFQLNKHFLMLMTATLIYAGAAIIDNIIISQQHFTPLFFQTINFGIPALLILLVNPKSIKQLRTLYTKATFKYVLLNGLFFFMSFWAIFQAYDSGGVTSEVNFALSSETILTVLLAAIFLKEKDHLKLKVFCSILVIAGLFLLS